MNNRPIGLFDSGIGGLSILDKLKELLPNENFIYLADNKNCPYGRRSRKEILSLSVKNCKKLIEFNCKIIIIACNTATTNAIEKLREDISIPIIGIEPGIKTAILHSKTKNIGILATEKTLDSKLFFETIKKNNYHDIRIHEQIGYKLVNIIEEGLIKKNELYMILKSYLNPMIVNNIDFLVLGCSHYNFIKEVIREILPNYISIIDIIHPVNKQVYNILKSEELFNTLNKDRYIKLFYNGKKPSKRYIKQDYELSYYLF
tara:strand:- start:288 stop:1067 length:780 start_codon:yes stop_codon:yes gene_type:complete